MNFAWIIGISISLLIALSVWCLVRVRQEFSRDRSQLTAVIVWTIYLLHLAIIIAVAVRPLWPVPIPWTLRTILGGVLLAAGVALAGLGMLAFGTVKRMSGQDTSRLMTDGIYVWSRNPQNVGWIAAQLGIALWGGSALALLMSLVFGSLFLIYVRFEERHLEAVFGDEYRAYLRHSHRILGLPGSEPEDFDSSPQPAARRLGDSPTKRRKVSPMPRAARRR